MTTLEQLPAVPATPAGWVERDLRRLAAAATAGLALGFVVNGVGSRVAMMLLARLNPQATGVTSDDGFRMGQFDLAATANLVTFATALGVLGALIYLAVRSLRFGPRWFQVASMVTGPAVVIGAMLVHTGGVDFTLLEPVELSIALFVALPGLYAFAVSTLVDRWTDDDSWFLRGSRWRLLTLVPLVLVIPALPLLAPLAVGAVVYRTSPAARRVLTSPATVWTARAAFTALFAVALVDLVRDTLTLT